MRKALKPTGCRSRSMILYASFGEATGLNTSESLEVALPEFEAELFHSFQQDFLRVQPAASA